MSNYNVFRADRNVNTSNKMLGGGVLIAVKKIYRSSLVKLGNKVDSVFIRINLNDLQLVIGGVYSPPNSAVEFIKVNAWIWKVFIT